MWLIPALLEGAALDSENKMSNVNVEKVLLWK